MTLRLVGRLFPNVSRQAKTTTGKTRLRAVGVTAKKEKYAQPEEYCMKKIGHESFTGKIPPIGRLDRENSARETFMGERGVATGQEL